MNENVLVWIHPDCLNPCGAALTKYSTAPKVFVFDDEWLLTDSISLKRIAFIYECLLEIEGVEIRKGQVIKEILEAMSSSHCDSIVVVESVDPRFAEIVAEFRRKNIQVEILAAEPLVKLAAGEAERLDLKRFSRYWNQVKRRAMSLNESLF